MDGELGKTSELPPKEDPDPEHRPLEAPTPRGKSVKQL